MYTYQKYYSLPYSFCLQTAERPEVSLVPKEVRPLRGLLRPPPRPAQQGQAVLLLLGAGLRGGAGRKKKITSSQLWNWKNFFKTIIPGRPGQVPWLQVRVSRGRVGVDARGAVQEEELPSQQQQQQQQQQEQERHPRLQIEEGGSGQDEEADAAAPGKEAEDGGGGGGERGGAEEGKRGRWGRRRTRGRRRRG